MRLVLLCLAVLCALATCVTAEYCHGHPDPNAQPNMNPLAKDAPVFVTSVPNGALYHATVNDITVPVVHLWGTPYQKGYAHGQLMKERMATFIHAVWGYLEDQVEQALNGTGIHIDPKTAKWIADVGLDIALDVESDWTKNFTGDYFFEEMHGMADATGVPYATIRRIHMLGELTKGSCSMFGAWGPALPGGSGLLTMRALDWDIDGPFRDFPELTVYHAAPGSDENDFVNIGWTGWIGSISGVNNQQMSVHEIGVAFPDPSFGNESRIGVPFTYVLRDILQFDKTRLDGVSRLASSERTCNLILGVGGGKEQRFNSVEYSHSVCHIMDDTNMLPVGDWHQRIPGVVYHGMDWLCPPFNEVLHDQLKKYHGTLTPQDAIQDIMPIVQTGDLHVYVADLVNEQLFVAFAAPTGAAEPVKAYDRTYLHVDLRSLYKVSPPSL